jgi:hypothetical protein
LQRKWWKYWEVGEWLAAGNEPETSRERRNKSTTQSPLGLHQLHQFVNGCGGIAVGRRRRVADCADYCGRGGSIRKNGGLVIGQGMGVEGGGIVEVED